MTRWSTIALSALSAVIGGAVVACALLWALAARPGLMQTTAPAPIAGTGYQLLSNFNCRFGETRHVLVNGLDDNFAYGEPELTRASDHLAQYPGLNANWPNKRHYDDGGQDLEFSDWFEIPSHIVSGRFVIRLKMREDSGNDYLMLGDLSNIVIEERIVGKYAFSSTLNELDSHEGWVDHGDGLFSVALEDLIFRQIEPDLRSIERTWSHLLPYLADQAEHPRLDLIVTDDTAVDFAGLTLCTKPAQPRGLSFARSRGLDLITEDFQIVACHPDIQESACNPFYGDTLCSTAQPLACYRDVSRPAPAETALADLTLGWNYDIVRNWGGGDLEFTRPVRGDSFATIDDATALCRAEFGADWRVLTFHDGGERFVATYPSSRKPEGRFWVDIRDQPDATCWARSAVTPIQSKQAER